MNRIQPIFQNKEKIVSVYFTAGFPTINDTEKVIKNLASAGVDMIEIGLPFSDPLADGPTIQRSSEIALENGMHTQLLFEQIENIREEVEIPLLIMGYFNPILQYGVEEFCQKCQAIGIDGLIIPDLPLEVYQSEFQSIFERYNLSNIFFVTPQTTMDRIQLIDQISNGFIYLISSAGTTGSTGEIDPNQIKYFERIDKMNLTSPIVVGFGIHDRKSFDVSTQYFDGGIIGSAFIKHLEQNGTESCSGFVQQFL